MGITFEDLGPQHHTLVVAEVIRHHAGIIQGLRADYGAPHNRRDLDVLTVAVDLPAFDPVAREAAELIIRSYPWLARARRGLGSWTRLALRGVELGVRKADDVESLLKLLESVRAKSETAGAKGLAIGVDVAIAIVRDGLTSIYDPKSDLFGADAPQAQKSVGESVAHVATHDVVGAVAGGVAGAAGAAIATWWSGPGTAPSAGVAGTIGAVGGGVVSSANAATEEIENAMAEEPEAVTPE